MSRMIIFDMDGTIADLYAVPNWEPMLRAENPFPYREAEPMWDMEALNMVLELLKAEGWEIRIVTWLSKNSSEDYKQEVRRAKKEWLAEYCFPYDKFHGVQYGATKAKSLRPVPDIGILVDDNAKVRAGWHLGPTIDPTEGNLIEKLAALLA